MKPPLRFNEGIAKRRAVIRVPTGGSWWTAAPREAFTAKAEQQFNWRMRQTTVIPSVADARAPKSHSRYDAVLDVEYLGTVQDLVGAVESAESETE